MFAVAQQVAPITPVLFDGSEFGHPGYVDAVELTSRFMGWTKAISKDFINKKLRSIAGRLHSRAMGGLRRQPDIDGLRGHEARNPQRDSRTMEHIAGSYGAVRPAKFCLPVFHGVASDLPLTGCSRFWASTVSTILERDQC